MASTYEPIATYTASGSISTYTFSSIPATYTDLILVKSGAISGGDNTFMRFNGDTGSNYSTTIIQGSGSAASSGRSTNSTSAGVGYTGDANEIMQIIQIMNYANTTTYKTAISRSNSSTTNGYVQAGVELWRSTAAINSVTLFQGSTNFNTGTTFTLYGIKAA